MRLIVNAQRRQGEKWIGDRGVSIEQAYILGMLLESPGSIQRDIAEATDRTEANVSAMLQKMEKRGLIERRLEDGDDRSKRVYATEAGHGIVAGLNEAMAAVDELILTPLIHEERLMLDGLLDKIAAEVPRRWQA